MDYAIAYSSRTGNTKMLADTIKNTLSSEHIIYFGPLNDKALEADRIFLGFWTNQGICDADTQQFIKKLRKQEVFLFGTAGLGSSTDYYDKIIQNTRKLFPDTAKFFASFMCQGKMPLEVRQRYLQMKQQPNPATNLDRLIKNFESSLGHPSKDDLRNFAAWLRKF